MFSVTTKTKYGLLAAMDLAEHYGRDLVQIKDIAKRRDIPKNYLEQILNRLTKTGIISSVRGNKGGYVLGKDPKHLTLREILDALEGEMKLSETAEIQALREVFDDLEEKIRQALQISLAQLVEKQQASDNQISFDI